MLQSNIHGTKKELNLVWIMIVYSEMMDKSESGKNEIEESMILLFLTSESFSFYDNTHMLAHITHPHAYITAREILN